MAAKHGPGTHTPEQDAVNIAIALVVLAVLITAAWQWLLPAFHVEANLDFSKGQSLSPFAAFYASAQVVERLMEPVTLLLDKWSLTRDDKKSNRIVVIHSLALLVTALASNAFQLHFLKAVGFATMPGWADILATALLISGGTKPLHDFISYLQQKKDATRNTLTST
jgi:hypothetical protein